MRNVQPRSSQPDRGARTAHKETDDGGSCRKKDPSRSIRVLHVIDSLVVGGKERQLLELLKGLQTEAEISSMVVLMSADVQFPEFARMNCPVQILTRRHRYAAAIFPQLYGVARKFRPDIVHSWNSMCSVYAAPIAKLMGARFVNGYVRAAIPDLTLRDKDYFRGKLLMPFSDVVVANSEAGLAAYRVPVRKGICIHNGFDHRRLEGLPPAPTVRATLGIASANIVGMVASFSDLKDYDTFLRAARAIVSLRGDVTFVAIGDGDNFLRLRALVPPERYPGIRLLGRRQVVENLVNIFTVGVLTSMRGEGIANAIMEYMALGKPVVATDCAGNRELVEHGRTGYLITNGDAAALTSRILEFLDNPPLAAQFGEAGRRRIRETFGLERMTQSYIRLYRDLMK